MRVWSILLVLAVLLLSACGAEPTAGGPLKVVAVESFLADIAQNIAGDRLQVTALMPLGVDPHGFQATPADLATVASSNILIINGSGLEAFIDEMLKNAGGQRILIEASAGLTMRESSEETGDGHEEGDPHFWLDPLNVIAYVENIRDGLSRADPTGSAGYAANAEAYTKQLRDLDSWIKQQVSAIPEANRLLVTNHESLGYFADRYDFRVVGTILASSSSMASPSAQDLARLTAHIKETGAKAIFLETGTNPQLANQLAKETGIRLAPEIYSHSLTTGQPAPTYIDMMKYNVTTIVNALK
jgi:ABC-type Zn uptake system ZnuABC Zn-binding protein ZnuA